MTRVLQAASALEEPVSGAIDLAHRYPNEFWDWLGWGEAVLERRLEEKRERERERQKAEAVKRIRGR